VLKHPPHENRTPSGYRPGPLKASDGTRYLVEASGQIRRLEPKMGKAEAKRHKRHKQEHRLENLRHQERAVRTAGGTPAPLDACPSRERS
jgi:hypothetical protein